MSIQQGDAEVSPGLPNVLYHLTDTRGFVGIVSSKQLWANLSTASNDASESRYGHRLAIETLQKRLAVNRNDWDNAIFEDLSSPRRVTSQIEEFPLVISFCGHCGKAGQWLHYGWSGRGVALGFKTTIAASVTMDLSPIDYNRESQRRRMENLFDAARGAAGASPTSAELREGARITSLYVSWLAMRMKDSSFKEEDEWRLSGQVIVAGGEIQDNSIIKYRQSDDRLIPYEEVVFRVADLQHVVVGYSSALSLDAASLILASHGFTAEVERSKVPIQ